MKQLTQAIFKDAPDWVKSAATDEDGKVFGYECEVYWLGFEEDAGYWFSRHEDLKLAVLISSKCEVSDWKNSAIDREVSA